MIWSAPRIPDYEVLDEIDSHGFQRIYRAHHLVTRAEVAIDALPGQFVGQNAPLSFVHQAQTLARIDHPNVIKTFGAGELSDGTCFLVTEAFAGEVLSRFLREHTITVARALRLARQLAIGVRCIHDAGAILRNVKPQAAMLFPTDSDPDGYLLKLIRVSMVEIRDGSIARWITDVPTGTPQYMSPEQINCDPEIDLRSDIYNFGVTLYEMLSGRRPFGGENLEAVFNAHLEQPPPSLRGLAYMSAEVDELVLACLAKDRADRPQTMTQVIAALEHAIATT